MAQLTWYLKAATGNWDAANAWNDAADGSGTDRTNPQNDGSNTYICDLNGKAVSLNTAVSVDQIRTGATNAGGTLAIPNSTAATITVALTNGAYSNYNGAMVTWGTGTSSLTINGTTGNAVTYASTATGGMIPYTTSQTVTTTAGTISNSSSGYALAGAGSGILSITNTGGTATSCSGSGRAVSHASTGSLTISATVAGDNSSTGTAVVTNAACTYTIGGNFTQSSGAGTGCFWGNNGTGTITGNAIGSSTTVASYGVLHFSNGTHTIAGNIVSSNVHRGVTIVGGTVNWTGTRTIAAEADATIFLSGGTLNLATASAKLALANSGSFMLWKSGGTLNTADAGAGAAEIVNQSAASYASMPGCTVAQKGIIAGPTIPAEADVKDGVFFGYASADEGTYAGGGGYTYGDENPDLVLTTATGAGHYVVPVQASVLCVADGGTAYGPGSGTAGTATLPLAADVQSGAADFGVFGALRDPAYQTTAATQAADAATLETDKAYLLATKTITFGASSIVGTLAVANVLSAVTGGTYHAPDAAEVINTAVFGPSSGTPGTYDVGLYQLKTDSVLVSAISADIVKSGSTITATSGATHVDGTYSPAAGYTYGSENQAHVLTTATGTGTYQPVATTDVKKDVAVGVSPAVGTYDPVTGNYTDPGKANVVVGNDYTFAGASQVAAYPTTATTTASVQATDAATLTGTTLDADGTDTTIAFGASNGTAKSGAVYTAGQAAQLSTDTAAVTAVLGSITTAVTNLLGVSTLDGTLNMGSYTLTASIDYPAAANVLESDTVGGTQGTYHEATTAEVQDGVRFGPLSAYEGTLEVTGGTGAQYLVLTVGGGT